MIKSVLLLGRLSLAAQLRRHVTSILLVALPLLFFAAIRSNDLESGAVALGIGFSWSIASLAAYTLQSNRRLDGRLAFAGLDPTTLLLGRLSSFVATAVIGAVVLSGVVVLVEPDLSFSTLVVGLLLAGIPALAVGMLIGVITPSELEATLVVLAVFGIPFGLSLDSGLLKITPGYASRQYLALLGETLDPSHVLQAATYTAVAIVLATLIWRRRTLSTGSI